MKTNRLLESGLLNSGEPRHFGSWEFPGVPKLQRPDNHAVSEAIYRRQKAFAPSVRNRRGLSHLINLIWHR